MSSSDLLTNIFIIFAIVTWTILILKIISFLINKIIFHGKFSFKNLRYSKKRSKKAIIKNNKLEKNLHYKYDGFSDEKTRNYAKTVGARNLKQLLLIQQYNAPDYATAKKIVSGNFDSYNQFLEAESLGARTESELIFIKKYNAPNLEKAIEIKRAGFETYGEYQNALQKGATNLEELRLVERMGTTNLEEAKKIKSAGFENGIIYRLAVSKGFSDYEGWKNFLSQRNEQLYHYKKLKKDLSKDYIMNEFQITDINELLSLLGKINVPIMGNKILFSYDDTSNKTIDKPYSEFELNDIIGMDEDAEICKICLKPLIGDIGVCPKCQTNFHYECVTTWIVNKKSCPVCLENLDTSIILVSEQEGKKEQSIKCKLCKKIINPLEVIIRCDYCQAIYHKFEFLEYIKIKGKCLQCNQPMIF